MPRLEGRGSPPRAGTQGLLQRRWTPRSAFLHTHPLSSSPKAPQGRGQGGTMFCWAGQVGMRSLPEGADLSAKTSEYVGLGVAWQGGRRQAVGRTAGALQPWSRACWRARASSAPGAPELGRLPTKQTAAMVTVCPVCMHWELGGESGAQTAAAPWPSPAAMCDNSTHQTCVSGSLGPMCWQRWALWPAPLEPQGGAGLWDSGEALNPLPRCKLCCRPRAPYLPLRSAPTTERVHKAPHPSGCSSRLRGAN